MRTWVAEMPGVEYPICTLSDGKPCRVNLPPTIDGNPHPLGTPLQRAPIDHPQVGTILDQLVNR